MAEAPGRLGGTKGNDMTNESSPPPFRFRASCGGLLPDEIARIEALATEQLRAGVSFASVQAGALALLRLAISMADAELVPLSGAVPACTRSAEPSPCATLEDHR